MMTLPTAVVVVSVITGAEAAVAAKVDMRKVESKKCIMVVVEAIDQRFATTRDDGEEGCKEVKEQLA